MRGERSEKTKTKENNTQKVRKLFSSVRVQARDFRVMNIKGRELEKLELLMKKATERLGLKLKQKKP